MSLATIRRHAALLIVAACSQFETSSEPATDAGTSDAGADTGSGSDAGNDDGDTRRFCERLTPTPTFCRDFDDNAPALFGWDDSEVADGGRLELSTMNPRTPPASLLLSVPGGELPDGGAFGVVSTWVLRRFSEPPAQMARMEFDLYAEDATSTDPGARIMDFCYPTADMTYCVWIEIRQAGAKVYEQRFPVNNDLETYAHDIDLPLPLRKWIRISLTVTVAGSPNVTLTVDGTNAPLRDAFHVPLPSPGQARFTLRSTYYDTQRKPVPTTTFHFDDVAVDLK